MRFSEKDYLRMCVIRLILLTVWVFQLRDLRSLFVKFDSDGNGELDVDEMKLMIDQLKIVATTDDLKVQLFLPL